jgi:amino acid efflux transporter
VAEEFENPQRDFHRSIIFSVLLISFLYLANAFVTIGTRAYEAGGSVAPFAAILSNILGRHAAEGPAFVAVFIIFGTVDAYTTGVSRLLYAVARDRGLPRILNRLNPKTKVPDRILLVLLSSYAVVLVIFYFSQVDLETALLVPSGAAILVYVVGSAAGVKILGRSPGRMNLILPLASLGVSLMVLPFIGPLLLASFAVVLAALAYLFLSNRAARS